MANNFNTAQKNGAKRLQKFDKFFNDLLGINTIDLVEGVTGAIVWGFLIVWLRGVLPLSPVLGNFIAYLLAWFSQRLVINQWRESDLFKKQTEEQRFLETTGKKIIKQHYNEQNVYQPEPPADDRYLIIK